MSVEASSQEPVASRATSARSFREVIVWQKAHAWVLSIYSLTRTFPGHELYGLTNQLRRASVSVPANFAEGFAKKSLADKLRMYNISHCSLEEARYYLILASDLGYGDTSAAQKKADELSRLLTSYARAIKIRSR